MADPVRKAAITALMKEKLGYGNIRYDSGKTWRSWNGSMRKALPTGVGHSPLDATQAKPQKVAERLKEAVNAIARLGGTARFVDDNWATIEFNGGTKHQLKVTLQVQRYPSYPRGAGYDSSYETSWIDVTFD